MISKNELLSFRFIRAGGAFANVAAKTTIDLSDISGFVYNGTTFYGVSNESTVSFPAVQRASIQYGNFFNEDTAKSSIDASFGQGKIRQGRTFVVRYTGTSVYPTQVRFPIRTGAPFVNAAKSSINASEFDYFRQGAPFWVTFSGSTPPPAFNAAQFFVMF